jgi:hypothetical protein
MLSSCIADQFLPPQNVLALAQHRPSPSSLQYVDPPGLIHPDKIPTCSQDGTLVTNVRPPPCSPPDVNTRCVVARLPGQVPVHSERSCSIFFRRPLAPPTTTYTTFFKTRAASACHLVGLHLVACPYIPHVVYGIGLRLPPLGVVAACNSNNSWHLPVAVNLPAYQRAHRWR